jgi:hypothetical protein
MPGRVFLRAAVVVVPLALLLPANAVEPVVVDQAGDATPDPCYAAAAWTCQGVQGESQPAVDVTAVHVASTRPDFTVDISYLDVDRPIAGLSAEDVVTDTVTFSIGPARAPRWASVWLTGTRRFDGSSTSSASEVVVIGADGSERMAGTATVDPAADRVRLSIPFAALAQAVQATCGACPQLVPGAVLRDFFAHSRAAVLVGAGGVGLVAHNVGRDDGWPGGRTFRIPA